MTPADYGCKCEGCPFAKNGVAKDFVLPEGPRSPAGVVFADIPTFDDARLGVPMAANSQVGREWDKTLMQAGLTREQLLIVPVTACKRPHATKEAQVSKAIKACAPMRAAAVALTPAAPHIVLGKYAWEGLTGSNKGSDAQRGFVKDNRTVTFRPEMAYFWAPHEWASFDIDVRRFGRMIRGELEPAPKITLVSASGQIAGIYLRAKKEGWVAFDIETMPANYEEPWTGKDPTRAQLRTLSFGWGDEGFSFFWKDTATHGQEMVRDLLIDPKVVKVGINIIWFDLRVLARYGLKVTPFDDCRDKRRAISSTSRLSLAYLATQYTDAIPWKEMKDEESEDGSK